MGRGNSTACYRELGNELRELRVAAGLTLDELAERTGWHRSTLSRIETGDRESEPYEVVIFAGDCGTYLRDAKHLAAKARVAAAKPGYWLSPHDQWLEDSLSS